MQPKAPYAEPSSAELKRPVALPRAPSIKINTKGFGTPRPSISGPVDGQPFSATPAARKPSISISKTASDIPVPVSVKRPLADKDDNASSAAKRPKTEAPTQPNGLDNQQRRRSKIVTLKTSNPKRLALVLGKRSPTPGGPARASLPGMVKAESTPEEARDSIVAKPVRKPLPTTGESVRKPLPTGGSSMSPPPLPPKMTIDTNPRVSPAGGQAGSPPPPTPGSATGRPKIKIIRKPQPGASSSPPAP